MTRLPPQSAAPMPPVAPRPSSSVADPFRIMVVEDSAVIRGLLTRVLESDPALRVVSSVGDGAMAVRSIGRQNIDVVVLDIEMPVMDGLTALPKLLQASPRSRVIMASTLTERNADISLRALQMGAADYVTKPKSGRELQSADAFKRELLGKVKALAAAARKGASAATPAAAPRRAFSAERTRPLAPVAAAPVRAAAPAGLRTRPVPAGFRPEAIAIGSSTGGPQALFQLLKEIGREARLPILITQHMPATFTRILAEHITRQCDLDTAEASDGMTVTPGKAYVAPGDWHMTVRASGGLPTIRVNQEAPENFCRPAVDVMLRSLSEVYGPRLLTVILTGMGQDGLRGCERVVAAGGVVLSQDEASSVVWGMPGAVSTAGLSSDILPLKDIGSAIRRLVQSKAA